LPNTADYYRTVIVPSRVRKPKDKASVEGAVGYISRQIIASLRNYQCFHIDELNQQIFKKLEEINTIDFQKRPGSRKKVFEEEEKSHLQKLPQTRYKLSEWKTARVQLNYHIQVDCVLQAKSLEDCNEKFRTLPAHFFFDFID
jgi:maltooligosyltrehalose synthase